MSKRIFLPVLLFLTLAGGGVWAKSSSSTKSATPVPTAVKIKGVKNAVGGPFSPKENPTKKKKTTLSRTGSCDKETVKRNDSSWTNTCDTSGEIGEWIEAVGAFCDTSCYHLFVHCCRRNYHDEEYKMSISDYNEMASEADGSADSWFENVFDGGDCLDECADYVDTQTSSVLSECYDHYLSSSSIGEDYEQAWESCCQKGGCSWETGDDGGKQCRCNSSESQSEADSMLSSVNSCVASSSAADGVETAWAECDARAAAYYTRHSENCTANCP